VAPVRLEQRAPIHINDFLMLIGADFEVGKWQTKILYHIRNLSFRR